MRKLLLALLGVLGLSASAAQAQSVVPNTLSGNECWNAGQGPGGPSTGFMCAYMIRNGQALTIITGSGAATTLMTPQQSNLMWNSTAPTSWTVTTPAIPFDGEMLTLASTATLTSIVTLTANTGQTLNPAFTSGTVTAASSVEYQYNFASATWFRIR